MIIQVTGTYSAAFAVTGVLGVAGALAVWMFVRNKADRANHQTATA